jgi:hypothetical protein
VETLASTFPLLGDYLAWKVGDRIMVSNGVNAIMGCGNMIFIHFKLIQYFQEIYMVYLNQVVNEETIDINSQG